ncbi:MAG TPA: hypothetical protein VHC67_04320 [Gaiellaceae bacterium]|jgi:hypothetical protein|nr:hypothetical protein [Gaiellaceae bacterium]
MTPQVGILPASGRRVAVGEPSGDDELLALEGAGSPVETMLALAARLVSGVDDWRVLPAADLAAAALLVRRAWIGRTIRTDAFCPAPGCGERIEIAFSVEEYVDHHRPRAYRGVGEPEPGVYELAGARFRLPTVGDLLDGTLHECIAEGAPPAVARRIERALQALAPSLAGELAGVCPECGATVDLWFEPVDYVLAELRDASAALFQQVHELASAYHWTEHAILALDRRRRTRYVELVREEVLL